MTLTYFTKKNKELAYCDPDFEDWFNEEEDTPVEGDSQLKYVDLPHTMSDEEIVNRYNIKPMTLGEVVYILKYRKDLAKYNIFYAKDRSENIFVVYADRRSGGWRACLYRFGDGGGWGVGNRVFFRAHSDSLDTLTLESRIKELEDFKSRVERVLNLSGL